MSLRNWSYAAALWLIASSNALATDVGSEQLRAWLRSGQLEQLIRTVEPELANLDDATRDRLELLGLAYQRSGQLSKARDAYRRYLDSFPDAPEAARVQQRLNAMLTAQLPRASGPDDDDPSAGDDARDPAWRSRTVWSAFTFVQGSRQQSSSISGTSGSNASKRLQLTSNLDARLDNDSARLPIGLRAQIGFTSDVSGGTVETTPRIRRLWGEVGDEWQVRIGRQRVRRLGIYGTLDGARVAWQVRPNWTIHGAAGAPLAFGELKPDVAHRAFSVGATFEPESRYSVSGYFSDDRVDGMNNRRALGGEFRFRSGSVQAYANADFDTLHRALNLASGRVTWQSTSWLEAYVAFDHRLSPFAATTNALIGQNGDELQDLRDRGISESILRDIATRLSIEVQSTTIGTTLLPAEDWRLSARLTRGDQSGNRGVPELRNLKDELLLREIPGFDGSGPRTELWSQVVRERIGDRLTLGASARMTKRDAGNEVLGTLFGRWRHPSGLSLEPRLRFLNSQMDSTDRRGTLLELRAGMRSARGSTVTLDISYSIDRIARPSGDVDARRMAAFIGYVLML